MRTPLIVLAILAPWAAGCLVPASQRDNAVATADAERARREAGEIELRALREQLAELQRRLSAATAAIEEARKQQAQDDYDLAAARRERDDAMEVVDQLRAELERVARHLRAFGERNKALARELDDMKDRADRLTALQDEADERAKMMADLAIALRDDARAGVVALDIVGGRPMVRLLPRGAFSGEQLTFAGTRAVRDVVGVVEPSKSRLVIVAPAGPGAVDGARADAVAKALASTGLAADRISRGTDSPPSEGEGGVELSIRRRPQ